MSVLSQIEIDEIEYPSSDGEPMAESDITRLYMTYSVEALDIYFEERSDVYVSANSFVYYEQGNRDAVVAPDVYVVLGVRKRKRDNYKVWQEGGITPDFVLEITSETTQEKDRAIKPEIYRNLGVREYFQYDPSGDYLNPILQGVRLIEGNYEPIPSQGTAFDTYSLWSEVLGLELHLVSGELRFRDPQTGEFLKTHRESETERKETKAALQRSEAKFRSLVRQLVNSGLEIDRVAQMTQLSEEKIRQLLDE